MEDVQVYAMPTLEQVGEFSENTLGAGFGPYDGNALQADGSAGAF